MASWLLLWLWGFPGGLFYLSWPRFSFFFSTISHISSSYCVPWRFLLASRLLLTLLVGDFFPYCYFSTSGIPYQLSGWQHHCCLHPDGRGSPRTCSRTISWFSFVAFPVVGCLGVSVFPFPCAFSTWSLVATGSREHFLGPTLTWMALAMVSIASKPILGFAILPISFGFGRLLAFFLIFHFSWIPPFSFGWYLDHFPGSI